MIKRTTALFKDGSVQESSYKVRPLVTVVKPGGKDRAIEATVVSAGLSQEDWDEVIAMEKAMDPGDRTIRVIRE